MGLPHRGYSISAGSDADTENEAVMSPEHAMRLWGRGVKSGRSSCLSSRSNSALTLTDTEHENKSDSENGCLLLSHPELEVPTFPSLPGYSASCIAGPRDVEVFVLLLLPVSTTSSAPCELMTFDTRQTRR
ncbi:hypothetical protein E2I00_017642, partial [Balaenoptera physalus]